MEQFQMTILHQRIIIATDNNSGSGGNESDRSNGTAISDGNDSGSSNSGNSSSGNNNSGSNNSNNSQEYKTGRYHSSKHSSINFFAACNRSSTNVSEPWPPSSETLHQNWSGSHCLFTAQLHSVFIG